MIYFLKFELTNSKPYIYMEENLEDLFPSKMSPKKPLPKSSDNKSEKGKEKEQVKEKVEIKDKK